MAIVMVHADQQSYDLPVEWVVVLNEGLDPAWWWFVAVQ